ncbi:MAG TPA: ATP-binding protein [Streptosporangiaceae bacterium]|nr:ATP-binding protein [Streptosporangiaceae bacterium]
MNVSRLLGADPAPSDLHRQPGFGARGLYVTIVRALGGRPRYPKAELMAQAGDLLAAEAGETHRGVVIICDEAHLLDPAQLEELRLLTNAP